MRVAQSSQMQIGEVDISQIKFDPKSRDDISKILQGLQHLYVNLALREKIFDLLEAEISPKVDKRNGPPGMALRTIFVCGVLRLDLNQDYDRLHDLVNHHSAIRQMLGHGTFNEGFISKKRRRASSGRVHWPASSPVVSRKGAAIFRNIAKKDACFFAHTQN